MCCDGGLQRDDVVPRSYAPSSDGMRMVGGERCGIDRRPLKRPPPFGRDLRVTPPLPSLRDGRCVAPLGSRLITSARPTPHLHGGLRPPCRCFGA